MAALAQLKSAMKVHVGAIFDMITYLSPVIVVRERVHVCYMLHIKEYWVSVV